MSKIWAVIPVKQLAKTKTRLAAVLSAEERAALTAHLLQRLLRQINGVPQIGDVVVVTRDATIREIARQHNAWVVAESEGEGLNTAVSLGVKFATQQGAAFALILPSDLPLVTANDLSWFLQPDIWGETAVSICSDDENLGTNALLIPTNSDFNFFYGANSFEQHTSESARLGLPLLQKTNANIQFDIDTVKDWNQYQNLATQKDV